MISFLTGQVIERSESVVTLLCRGVGYEVHCSDNTLEQTEVSKRVQLWIYTHVREDALQLFGFATKVERYLFLNLIKVNGIGPKMAIQILSGASLDTIIQAIEDKDVQALMALPRVGKKTAEQMILTLKGTLIFEPDQKTSPLLSVQKEIYSALIHLGFRSTDIEQVTSQLPQDIEFEQGLRESLKQLAQ